ADPRTSFGVETVIALAPEWLLDYVRFERTALSLRLEPPLRFRAAQDAGHRRPRQLVGIHALEREFGLGSEEILDIIRERPRLGMAVRGGVAERHLHRQFDSDPAILDVTLGMQEGPPDFFVTF